MPATVLVVDEDQSNAYGAHQKGQQHVEQLYIGLDVVIREAKHLGNGHVQKDTGTHGKDATNGKRVEIEQQNNDSTQQGRQSHDEIDHQGNHRVNPILVDHDQVSGQLVGNFVQDGCQNDRVSNGGSASDVGGSDKESIGQAMKEFSKIEGQKEGQILETDAPANGHESDFFGKVGFLGISFFDGGGIHDGGFIHVHFGRFVFVPVGEQGVQENRNEESTHDGSTPSPGSGSLAGPILQPSVVVAIPVKFGLNQEQGFGKQQENGSGQEGALYVT